MYWYSMIPEAGTSKGVGISTVTSGLMFQPVTKLMGAGLSLALPSGAPLSAQFTRILVSASVSLRSFWKWPYLASANHGGILCESTAAFIAFAQGRDS